MIYQCSTTLGCQGNEQDLPGKRSKKHTLLGKSLKGCVSGLLPYRAQPHPVRDRDAVPGCCSCNAHAAPLGTWIQPIPEPGAQTQELCKGKVCTSAGRQAGAGAGCFEVFSVNSSLVFQRGNGALLILTLPSSSSLLLTVLDFLPDTPSPLLCRCDILTVEMETLTTVKMPPTS